MYNARAPTKHLTLLTCAALLGLQNFGNAAEPVLEPGMVNPGYHEKPAWFKNSFLDIREDVRDAAKGSKRLILYFYQDGCPYCKLLIEDNFGQRRIAETTQRLFDAIAINMWGDRDVIDFKGETITEKAFAASLKVMFTPTLLFLDEKGDIVLRVNGYYPPEKFLAALEYVGQRKETELSFRDYYAKRAPTPTQGTLHKNPSFIQPPYRLTKLAAKSAKPLLVLFEQKRCAECDELHLDIFKRPETRRLLKRFNVVLLDMWSNAAVQTPGGQATKANQWARTLDIKYAPTLVFFDGGQEVFRTEAYLKEFHIQSVLDYVASRAYRSEPNFQRYIEHRAAKLREQGVKIDLMN